MRPSHKKFNSPNQERPMIKESVLDVVSEILEIEELVLRRPHPCAKTEMFPERPHVMRKGGIGWKTTTSRNRESERYFCFYCGDKMVGFSFVKAIFMPPWEKVAALKKYSI